MPNNDPDALLRAHGLLLPIDPEVERPKALAPGLLTLDGKVLGLLDNTKGNADHLLRRLAERLGERYALREVVSITKPIFSRLTPEAQLVRLKECDAVLTALAD